MTIVQLDSSSTTSLVHGEVGWVDSDCEASSTERKTPGRRTDGEHGEGSDCDLREHRPSG